MYHAKDIDVNNIKIDNNIKNIDNKIKFSLITYNGGGPLVIQTPTLKMPYDFMSVYKADDKDDNSSIPKDIVASFGDYKNISSNKKFYDKMKEINELVVNHVINNKLIGHVSNTISKSSDEVVRAYSIPLVKPYIDKDTREESDKYPPTIKFRVKINNDTGLYDMDCSDMVSGNKLNFNDIKGNLKGAHGKFLLKITGILFTKQGYCIRVNVLKAEFKFREMIEYSFMPDSEDDEKELDEETLEDDLMDEITDKKNAKTDKSDKSDKSGKSDKPAKPTMPIDSEDEDEEEDEEDSDDQVVVKPVTTKDSDDDGTEESEDEEETPPPPSPPKKGAKKSSTASKKK